VRPQILSGMPGVSAGHRVGLESERVPSWAELKRERLANASSFIASRGALAEPLSTAQ
jgi:hypothetical protein